MAGESQQRRAGAAVVVRAWIETSAHEAAGSYAPGDEASAPEAETSAPATGASARRAALRVRVVEVGAAAGEERTLCVTADPAEAGDVVRRWLEQLTR